MTDARASFILPPSAFILRTIGIASSLPERVSSRAHRDVRASRVGFFVARRIPPKCAGFLPQRAQRSRSVDRWKSFFVLFVPFVVSKRWVSRCSEEKGML